MPHRKKIIAGNWKMNKTASEAKLLLHDLILDIGKFDEADIVLCPPFTALSVVSELLLDVQNIKLGAQNLHQAASGAFTGEISAAMLRDLYVRYVIIGHSERRQYFGETDALVKEKTKTALNAALKPIVCIGETLKEREAGHWQKVVETQIRNGLGGFDEKEISEIVVAYEPVWAIGTGKTATGAQAQEVHAFARGIFKDIYGQAVSDKLRIQYGGSVKPENAAELLNQADIDGALVGGASLDSRSFTAIVKNSCLK